MAKPKRINHNAFSFPFPFPFPFPFNGYVIALGLFSIEHLEKS